MEGLAAGLCELPNKHEAIFFAPLAQSGFGSSIFVFVPGIELAIACKQRLEIGIRTSLAEEFVDLFSRVRKLLLNESEDKRTTKFKFGLVWHSDVKRSIFNVFRKLLIDSFATPMNRARVSADVCLAIHGDGFPAADPFVGSEQFIEVDRDAHNATFPAANVRRKGRIAACRKTSP